MGSGKPQVRVIKRRYPLELEGQPDAKGGRFYPPEDAPVPVKRSVTVAGHRTSVSLERAFWDGLQAIAAARGCSLNRIVTEVDRRRGAAGLSGSLRVFVLDHYRARSRDSGLTD